LHVPIDGLWLRECRRSSRGIYKSIGVYRIVKSGEQYQLTKIEDGEGVIAMRDFCEINHFPETLIDEWYTINDGKRVDFYRSEYSRVYYDGEELEFRSRGPDMTCFEFTMKATSRTELLGTVEKSDLTTARSGDLIWEERWQRPPADVSAKLEGDFNRKLVFSWNREGDALYFDHPNGTYLGACDMGAGGALTCTFNRGIFMFQHESFHRASADDYKLKDIIRRGFTETTSNDHPIRRLVSESGVLSPRISYHIVVMS